jgi:hypothetical protein
MLWHEFCHVLTLHLTQNKMPRWLSEGISVYEERQADPSWGEHLQPRYRDMLLGKELTPIAELSSAFLAPKSPVHLQFAYFQCSLVVQFVVERFGREPLLKVMRDLGNGAAINDALAKHVLPLPQLEKEFATFARGLAWGMGPGLDWEKPVPGSTLPGGAVVPELARGAADGLPRLREQDWQVWALYHPSNYWVMTRQADRMVGEQKWAEARPLLEKLVKGYPEAAGSDSAYPKLAAVYRALGETNAELQTLTRLAGQDDEARDAYLRLMELHAATGNWPEVSRYAQRYLAVDPLVAPPYRFLAQAGEAAQQLPVAIRSCEALLQLDPSNPAEVHFRLARLLHDSGDPTARLHLLQSLEEAPRNRAALRLLRQMRQERGSNTVSQGNAPAEATP